MGLKYEVWECDACGKEARSPRAPEGFFRVDLCVKRVDTGDSLVKINSPFVCSLECAADICQKLILPNARVTKKVGSP